MSYSFSVSKSESFTVTHARQMAAKVATDLKRMQRFYGSPCDTDIIGYESEVIEFLKKGYLGAVTYGYRRDGNWIEPTLRYTARDLAGAAANDDDPGKLRPGANVVGAEFHSYMTYSAAYHELSETERESFRKTLPFTRGGAPEPGINGYLSSDRTYSSGGRALDRATVRSW
jgi:hypothetical protein